MNAQFSSNEEILDYAIEKEEQAAQFYLELSQWKLPEEAKRMFEEFTETELKHKRFLEEVKEKRAYLKDENVQSLFIAEEAKEVEINDEMTIVEALTVAMKRELDAYRLYIELAAAATSYETLDIFSLLAQEEARHKLQLEIEYKNLLENLVLNK